MIHYQELHCSGQTHLNFFHYVKNQYFCIFYMESPLYYFSDLKDPRIDRTKDHLLEDIIVIAILSVICGAETWNDMEDFGNEKLNWLQTFLQLPEGIPSHDTFNISTGSITIVFFQFLTLNILRMLLFNGHVR